MILPFEFDRDDRQLEYLATNQLINLDYFNCVLFQFADQDLTLACHHAPALICFDSDCQLKVFLVFQLIWRELGSQLAQLDWRPGHLPQQLAFDQCFRDGLVFQALERAVRLTASLKMAVACQRR